MPCTLIFDLENPSKLVPEQNGCGRKFHDIRDIGVTMTVNPHRLHAFGGNSAVAHSSRSEDAQPVRSALDQLCL